MGSMWALNMNLLIIFGLFIVATAHNITLLEVPTYGDPRGVARLECHYVNEKGDPPLHSVKWYWDNNEIFRFTPGQQPPTRTFNTTTGTVTRGYCNMHNCTITVGLPSRYNTRLAFTCEVSTEGPRFAFVKQTKNLTVAVVLKQDPIITGVPPSVQLGEDVLLNCSTDYAMPPANIAWYIDGVPEKAFRFHTKQIEPWMSDNTEVTVPNAQGLRASWRPLRVRVTTPRGLVTVKCEATQPIRPPYMRSKSVNLVVARSPHLSMFTASGSNALEATVLLVIACMTSHVRAFSEHSALSDV